MGPGPLLTVAKPVAVAGLVEGAAGAAHRGQEGARRASAATARPGESEPGSRAKRSRGTNSFNSERLAPALQSASAQRSAGSGRAPLGGGAHLETEASHSWGEGAREGTAGTQKRTETRKEPGRAKVEKVVKAEKKVASEAGIKMRSFGRGGEGLGRAHVCHP